MSNPLPETVKPLRLAESGQILSGILPLARMKRLAALLNNPQGHVDVVMEFGVDIQNIKYMRGQVKTSLELICQRCMCPMNFPVALEMTLGFAGSNDEAKRLPENYEAFLLESSDVSTTAIVEDELILALPLVAMHAEDECTFKQAKGDETSDLSGKRQPFAELTKLKKSLHNSSH